MLPRDRKISLLDIIMLGGIVFALVGGIGALAWGWH